MKNEGKDIDEKEASESAVELNDLCRGNMYTWLSRRTNLQGSTLGVYIDPIKKSFKQKLLRIKFSTKKSVTAYLCLP